MTETDETGTMLERGPGARARRRQVIGAWARLALRYGVALPPEGPARGV